MRVGPLEPLTLITFTYFQNFGEFLEPRITQKITREELPWEQRLYRPGDTFFYPSFSVFRSVFLPVFLRFIRDKSRSNLHEEHKRYSLHLKSKSAQIKSSQMQIYHHNFFLCEVLFQFEHLKIPKNYVINNLHYPSPIRSLRCSSPLYPRYVGAVVKNPANGALTHLQTLLTTEIILPPLLYQ